jgi:hypothetical protein
VTLPVLYTHCHRCKHRLRAPIKHCPSHCHWCYDLSLVELPMGLPQIPSDAPPPAPGPVRRRVFWTSDDLSDMDRRGEYFDRYGDVQVTP